MFVMESLSLFNGEYAIENAPRTHFDDGRACVPQHYLQYSHTHSSVEELILKIDYCERYPIFVCQDDAGIYLQVGVIGTDNYLKDSQQEQVKIVYGRKWRVEPKLPTSEIIQTAFLAIKKAREHEVRELLRLKLNNNVTTPFNNHQDINLLSNHSLAISTEGDNVSWAELQRELNQVSYDHATFFVHNLERRNSNYWLLEIVMMSEVSTKQPELLDNPVIVLVINKLTIDEVLYQLMTQLIHLSDRHVDEHFKFAQVARFSRNISVKAIASISASTRQLHKTVALLEFEQHWLKSNYQTDLTRVPTLNASPLSLKIKAQLNSFGTIAGVLPKE